MNTVEVKVTVREEIKKTKVYDFTESIKALEETQRKSSAILTEVNELICETGVQSFENWIKRLHKELQPVLSNHGLMKILRDYKAYFGYASWDVYTKELSGADYMYFNIIHKQKNCIAVKLMADSFTIDYGIDFIPTENLRSFSEKADYVHKTIMEKIEKAIMATQYECKLKTEKQIKTLENLLNM